MISQEEHSAIHEFLKWYGVRHIEIYEELYDHVVSSFENRENISQDMKSHINEVVKPELGMSDGIYRILRENEIAFKKEIHQRALSIFKTHLFGWPSILTTIGIVALGLLLNETLGITSLFMTAILGLALISLSSTIFIIIFRLNARTQKKQVKKSLSNQIVDRFLSTGAIITIMTFTFFNKWADTDWIVSKVIETSVFATFFFVLFVLYALVCIRLVKEKFIFKLRT